METIYVESIVFNYFAHNADKREVKLNTIMQYVRELDKAFREANLMIYIDNTRGTFIDMISRHWDVLLLDDVEKAIKLKNPISKWDYKISNSKIPYRILDVFLKTFRKVDKELNTI